MKTITALAAMMLLYACGSEPSNVSEAVAVAANDTPTAPAEEKTRVEELAGNWRVVGVRVAPGPVQAVSDDDPALMGAVLSISPERLAWKPHEGGFFTDTCPGPQIGADNSIGCAEGRFGPPEAHLVSEGVQIKLDWYDGAILTLSRQ